MHPPPPSIFSDPSHRAHKPKTSPSSSTSTSTPQTKNQNQNHNQNNPPKRPPVSKHKAQIPRLRHFNPDLETQTLERRTQGLFMDQASLNFNLFSRLQKPAPQTSPQSLHFVPGPLQHPYAHLVLSTSTSTSTSISRVFAANTTQVVATNDGDGDVEDVEMRDAPDINIFESGVVTEKTEDRDKDEDEEEDKESGTFTPPTTISYSPTPALHPSKKSHLSHSYPSSLSPSAPNQTTKNPLHPLLQTSTTTTTREQISLELSLLIITKHNELRLIHSELALAQIMLEQLRRAHLVPHVYVIDEKGEVRAHRPVVEKEVEDLKKEEGRKRGTRTGLRSSSRIKCAKR
ncbi:hypothetical protein SBOR_6073 [Sclerotinia borealis F-4128]|uniref:Uncharacterized protein n=1 Tax=Sclerotinia borealis (strain F-4128) TaxID=1432307 RepID=W9CCE2_SCLBF|nr:hypothetical protein SBOR_6073 [Sclerotinia borealis F-4128]